MINTAQLKRIQDTLNQLVEEVNQLATDQATFDQHLADLNTAINDLIAAVEAKQAAAVDLTDEDTAVQAATDRVKAATDALNADAPVIAPEPNPDEPQVNPL